MFGLDASQTIRGIRVPSVRLAPGTRTRTSIATSASVSRTKEKLGPRSPVPCAIEARTITTNPASSGYVTFWKSRCAAIASLTERLTLVCSALLSGELGLTWRRTRSRRPSFRQKLFDLPFSARSRSLFRLHQFWAVWAAAMSEKASASSVEQRTCVTRPRECRVTLLCTGLALLVVKPHPTACASGDQMR